MKNSLITSITYAFVPAIALVLSKIIGLMLATLLFSIDIQTLEPSLLAVSPTANTTDVLVLTTFSDLFMVASMATIFSWFVVHAVFAHDTHISPKQIQWFHDRGWLHRIKSSFMLYHGGTVSLLFLWISVGLHGISVLQGNAYGWSIMLSFITAGSLSVIFIQDIARELRESARLA